MLSVCFHSQKLKVSYSKYCKILCRVIRDAKKMYYNQLLIHADRVKIACSIVKREREVKCVSPNICQHYSKMEIP